MKVERKKIEPVFEPVILILESQEEIDKLFALFNHAHVCNALNIGCASGNAWWRLLEKYRNVSGTNHFHDKLKNMFVRE